MSSPMNVPEPLSPVRDTGAEEQTCAWCGVALDSAARKPAGRICCPNCGVANTHPWPSDAELEAAYSTWYRPDTGRFSGVGDTLLRRTRGLLALRLDEIAPAGPILDVGAGDGALLDALSARGREALGLERRATRSDVREGDLGTVTGPWSAIVFWHSLEHLRNPGEELERAAGQLAPGGVLVVAVPNAASLQARLFGDRWLALDLPRHLVHLPAPALVARLNELSLNVERVSSWRGGQVLFGWLHGLVALLPSHPDLYDAIRRPEARREQRAAWPRSRTLAAAALLSPLAVFGALFEVAVGRGGTVYIEARHA
jgi:SAM-dependent methyltransferase